MAYNDIGELINLMKMDSLEIGHTRPQESITGLCLPSSAQHLTHNLLCGKTHLSA